MRMKHASFAHTNCTEYVFQVECQRNYELALTLFQVIEIPTRSVDCRGKGSARCESGRQPEKFSSELIDTSILNEFESPLKSSNAKS